MLPGVGTRYEGRQNRWLTNYSSEDLAKAGRLKQIRMVAKLVNQQNKRALPITFGVAVGVIVVFVLIGLFTGLIAFLIPVGRAARPARRR